MEFTVTYYCKICLVEADTTDPNNIRQRGGINICRKDANGCPTHVFRQAGTYNYKI